jgi:catechol 2,3-dioxygenase-like lactoylglutathione lyase family enzyme
MAEIQGMDHVAVNVTDVDRARAFYGGLLGLDEVSRPESFDFPGAWYRAGTMMLHLVGRKEAGALSSRHFCFIVKDLNAVKNRVVEAGYEVLWSGHKIPGVDRFFIRDPDGNRIEFQGPEVP